MEILTLGLIAVVTAILYLRYRSRSNAPGPWGLPFIGYLPFLGTKPFVKLTQLGQEYGDVFQVQMGTQTAIVLNSLSAIKEGLGKWEFADRPHTNSFREIQDVNIKQGYHGLAFFSRSPKWTYLRKVTVRALNNLVVSPHNKLEEYTRGALSYVNGQVDGLGPKGGSVRRVVFNAVNSVVSSMNFATVVPPNHPVLDDLYNSQEDFGAFLASNAIADFLPFLRPLGAAKKDKIMDIFKTTGAFMRGLIDKHEFNSAIFDVQVVRSDSELEPLESVGFKDIKEVKQVAQDLFAAGTFTTTEHFLFFLRAVAIWPRVQDRMREELDKVFPATDDGNTWISLGQKDHLPYCRAVIEEVFRFASQLPLLITHWTTQDTNFRGYFIPKDTLIMPNAWAVHYDPLVFLNPTEFRPERFIKADGEFNDVLARNVIPFSYGKRRCPGELMARRELFLLYSNFVRQYRVESVVWEGNGPWDCPPGFTRILKDASFTFTAL